MTKMINVEEQSPTSAAAEKATGSESLRHVSAYTTLLKKQAAELIKNLRQALKPKTVFLLAAAIVVIAFFGKNLKDILLVAFLAVVASYSTIYKRTIRVPGAIELVTIGTVVTGAAYGPVQGAAFGVLTTFAAAIISSGLNAFTALSAVARGISGAVSFYLGDTVSVVALGMISVVIENVIYQPIYLLSGDAEAIIGVIYYIIVNTVFNLLIFTFFGEILLKVAQF